MNKDNRFSCNCDELEIIFKKKENSILNGGPGSGNFNPGQGRGVGKPSDGSKKISYEEFVEKWKKSTRGEKRELEEEYPDYESRHWDELMSNYSKNREEERKQKELEEKFKTYEKDNSHPHFDLNKMVFEYKEALNITPEEYNGRWDEETQTFEKLKNLKEYYNIRKGMQVRIISMNPLDYSRTIIDNDDKHYTSMKVVRDRTSQGGIDMYKEKYEKGERVEIPYIKFNSEGKFEGWQEGFHRTLAASEIGDKEIPVAIVTDYYGKQPKLNYGRDITKEVEEYFARNNKENNSRFAKLNKLKITLNGGEGSGNFNPGQGRGIGKPNDFYMTTSRRSYCRKGDEVVAQYNKGNNEMGKVQGVLDWDSDNKPYITTKEGEKVYLSDLADYGLKLVRTSEEILNETHKTPKQRRTQKQKEAIDYLDNTVKIGYDTREWLYKYADEDVMISMAKVIKEAKELGLETNNRIILSKMRSSKAGTRQIWGRAWASGITEFPTKLLDATPWVIQEISKNSDRFHTNDSVEGVIRHEIGHQISYQNALFKLTSVDSYCKSILEKAVNDVTGGKEKDIMNYVKSNRDMMSKYGSKNYNESIAEAWSNPDYSSLTKNIAEQLKNDMKEHKDTMNQTIKINKRFEDFPLCSGYGPEFSDEEEFERDNNKIKVSNSRLVRLNNLQNSINNSQKENLDYRYDVIAYKEYLKDWLKHKDEPEYLRNGILSFSEFWEHDIDYEFEDYKKILKLIDEYNKKKELVINGGPGSGNPNPGQGRGIGKPADGHLSKSETQYFADNYLSKKEYENIVNYSNEDNFTDEELDAIASYAESMGYGKSCDLNQSIRENDRTGEIEERKEIIYPTDDSQIVTWKENKEFLENKIKEKEAYDKLHQEYEEFRQKYARDAEHREELIKRVEELNSAYRKLSYDDYSNYIENYKNGVYKDLKDDDRLWTVDNNKLKKVSVVELRKEQKNNSKEFYEIINIPRLAWSTYNPISTTTDTMATLYGNEFKKLDKLDNIIKNKGYQLEKDITVTRRVANIGVIKNKIKNNGKYIQNGITSTSASKSIVKKMPSGVHMGNDLVRITIPKGTRVISTYNPFVRDTKKKAEKYNEGRFDSEDERNLRMIKGQNELILPSGSKFISPGGNNLSQNPDGSYQLILVPENKVNRNQRLDFIKNKINNFNDKHDKLGRFAPKLGASYGNSSIISKDGKMLDKEYQNFSDVALDLQSSDEKVLGKTLNGKRFDLVSGDILADTIPYSAEDENRIDEIKQQIENKKKSGVIVITMDKNNNVNIRDGNHTYAAFMKLRNEGKIYYIPIILTTPRDIQEWESKFDSIEQLENTPKTLVNIKKFKS